MSYATYYIITFNTTSSSPPSEIVSNGQAFSLVN